MNKTRRKDHLNSTGMSSEYRHGHENASMTMIRESQSELNSTMNTTAGGGRASGNGGGRRQTGHMGVIYDSEEEGSDLDMRGHGDTQGSAADSMWVLGWMEWVLLEPGCAADYMRKCSCV